MRQNVVGVFRSVTARREDAKSKIGFGQFDHKSVQYQVRLGRARRVITCQLKRLIVLWLTLYDRAMSVSTSPASLRAMASRR
jgi:hypothetical protein